MIPAHRDLHPHIREALDLRACMGRRGHRHAGSLTTALTPFSAGMYRFKGGGIGGIFTSILVGAVLGAATGGIGFGLGFTAGSSVFGLSAGLSSAIASGAAMGAVGGLLTGAASAIMGQQQKSQAEQASYEARDNKITVRNSVAPRKIVLGTALVGGLLNYAASSGSNNTYLHMVVPHATHQMQALRETFFNNTPAGNSRYSGLYRINTHLGTQTQAADSDLLSEMSSEWNDSCRGRGTSYTYARLQYNQNAWVSGIPSISRMGEGAIVYDPRDTGVYLNTSTMAAPGVFSTVGAHGFAVGDIVFLIDHAGATYATPSGFAAAVAKAFTVNTVPDSTHFTLLDQGGEPMALLSGGAGGTVTKCRWSNNWTLGTLHYLLARDGINCATGEIDWTYFAAAANTSDQDVSLGMSQAVSSVSTSTNAFTLAADVGWSTGTQVYASTTGALPAPLAADTAYYWIAQDGNPNIGQLASNYDNAVGNDALGIAPNTAIDITTTGTGSHTIFVATSVTLSASADTATLSNTSTYIETGDGVTLTGSLAGTTYYWRNTDYLQGKLATSRANAIAGTFIDLTTDETVRITRVSQARYTVNGILDLSKKPIDILNDLLTAGGGVLVYTQGKYRLFAAEAGTSSMTIDETYLRDTIKIQNHTSRLDGLANAVRGTYKEPAKYWEMTDFPAVTNATYEEEDGGQQLYKDVALPHTIDPARAQRIASIALKRGRHDRTYLFPGTIKLLGISAWDCLTLNLTVGGTSLISGQKVRVVSWTLNENGNGIDLVLQDEDDTSYGWTPGLARHRAAIDLGSLPSPWVVAPPTGLSVQSGTDQLYISGDGTVHTRAYLSWTAPADKFVTSGGWVEIQYKKHADSAWLSATPVPGSQTSTYITDVDDATAYDFRVRSKNGIGAVSDLDGATWSATVSNHTVVGKSAPPADVAVFSAAQNGNVVVWQWGQVADLDLAGYRIGYGPQGGTAADATIVTSITRGTSVTSAAVPPGAWTFYIWSVDTSGNPSANAATANLTVANTNTVVAGTEQAGDFLGTASGFVRHWTGKLVPDGLYSWSHYATWGDLTTFAPDPVATATYDVPEIDLAIDGAERIWASISSTLLAGCAGSPAPDLYTDFKLEAGAYSGFSLTTVKNITARYLKFRMQWDSGKGAAVISAFLPQADVQQTTQSGTQVVAGGGTAITFPSAFHFTPNIQVTPQSGALIAAYTGASATGCTIHVYNTSGSDVGGTVTWQATGA